MRRRRVASDSTIHGARSWAPVVLGCALALGWTSAHATTFFVRVDGGDAAQCNGRADAPYPGSGLARNCAWKHPFFALAPNGTRRILGGDTLLIGSGSYMIGLGAPGAGTCVAANCSLAPVPSGLAGAPTRILGTPGNPPRLWGSKGVTRILGLEGSSNVEIGHLEITDQGDCVYHHVSTTARCGAVGSGTWGKYGIHARASTNVWLHDLNIHGLAHTGLWAGGLGNWTLERVRLHRNGRAGWDANIGLASTNTGTITLRGVEIAWNGCGERWKSGEAWACWSQQGGGYGDGLGTTTTGGRWLIEDSFVHHNTQDGLDLRFLDGADTTSATIRRLKAVANAGNQVKVKGNALVENSVLIGNCGYFSGKHFMLPTDHCRADGTTLQLVFTPNDSIVVRHNTITGEGWSLVGTSGGDPTARVLIQNNVLVGFPWFLRKSELSRVRAGTSAAVITYAGNLVWTVYANSCPPHSLCNQDPRLTNMALAAFDARPLPGSPVVDRVLPLAEVTTDFLLNVRPQGAASDIGAYEFTTPGVCQRGKPTLAISGPGAAVPAGSSVRFTVSLANNDNNKCAPTTYALARVLPAGWSGTLAASTITLSSGARGSTHLTVTSPPAAADGEYGVNVSVVSSVGGIHVVLAHATVTIGEPAPPGTPAAPRSLLPGPGRLPPP